MSDDDEGSDASSEVEIPEGDPGRRRFLKIATCAIGGGIGAVVAVPAVRYLLYPVGRDVVSAGGDPIDVGALDDLAIDGAPVRVRVVAPSVRDAWGATTNVALGAAWLRRPSASEVLALSASCPHLGCAIAFDGENYRCPCHDSAFDPEGAWITGPAERGMDPLPVQVDPATRRLRLTWVRYRPGGADRRPA